MASMDNVPRAARNVMPIRSGHLSKPKEGVFAFPGEIPSPPKFNTSTYTSANGCSMDGSLRVEMTYPDSMNDTYIGTFSMIGKQKEI
jgi:hypothetical protein